MLADWGTLLTSLLYFQLLHQRDSPPCPQVVPSRPESRQAAAANKHSEVHFPSCILDFCRLSLPGASRANATLVDLLHGNHCLLAVRWPVWRLALLKNACVCATGI